MNMNESGRLYVLRSNSRLSPDGDVESNQPNAVVREPTDSGFRLLLDGSGSGRFASTTRRDTLGTRTSKD
jgi:hypothetical protein